MPSSINAQLTPRIISIALTVVTLAVFTQSVTDPVNVTKLFLLGGFAFAALGSILNNASLQQIKKNKLSAAAAAAFVFISVLVLLNSEAPLSQSLYGVYGRNNGFLLYLLLVFLFIATLTLSKKSNFKVILYALLASGCVNVLYAMWVLAFGDFINWSNQYGNLLGTLGNPNFIGSFFGIFTGLLFAVIIEPKTSWKVRLVFTALVFLTAVAIIDTQAVQGKVLALSAFGIVIFYRIKSSARFQKWSIAYLTVVVMVFVLSLLGTLQIGPLSNFLYKTSISLRGQYWYAGWKTGVENPLFGVGFDSYGDWYRRSRRDSALELPGVDVVSNTAHNVYLDILSFGGFPLFISYILITILTLVSIVKYTIKVREYDLTFVALTTTWSCYQLQSVISINQVGLAIWGWVSSAAILGYTQIHFAKDNQAEKKSARRSMVERRTSNQLVSPSMLALLVSIVGMIVTSPPLSADMNWRKAQLSQDVNLVTATLVPSYMNPQNSFKFTNIVGLLETNGFKDLSHKYAIEAVRFNPESFESWRNLYQISNSTQLERDQALKNMIRLDPLNPNLASLPK